MSRRILVTSALPYANGSLHIGHLLEYVQTDIWVRYQRLAGNDCLWVWADDAHGTPIMLKAAAEGVEPETLIARYQAEHERDIAGFLLSPDNFHTTHSPENRETATLVYERLRDAGHIVRRTIEQLYDTTREMFLPDRFVKGGCPNCGTPDQYGDNCENCSATYDATELVDPISQVSGTRPVLRESEQLFFAAGHFEEMLRGWTRGGALQPEIANKMGEWLEAGLQDWDISRNAPYFGFEIPDAPGKYFYAWLDAPIAYIASHRHLAARTGEDWEETWRPGSPVELYHFIGKDIANFHCLFWPAMLEGAGFRKPTGVFCHGFLTVDGAKMSKSRGTSVTAGTWLEHLEPEYLRYYFAAKLSSSVVDLNLNLDDFVTRVNADLIGKVVNIASRCAGFITRRFDGRLAPALSESLQADYETFAAARSTILSWYEQREYGKAMREIMLLAEHANTFINDAEPWVRIKDPDAANEVHESCTLGLNQFRAIMTYLSPVLPALAAKSAAFLNTSLTLGALDAPLLDHPIEPYRPLMTRVEHAQVQRIIEATRRAADGAADGGAAARGGKRGGSSVGGEADDGAAGRGGKRGGSNGGGAAGDGGAGGEAAGGDAMSAGAGGSATDTHGAVRPARDAASATGDDGRGADAASIEPIAPEITIDDMTRVDLRVARIVDARAVEGADRLLELTLDIGLETRTVFAGIKAAYAPADLVGRHTVMVANLAPRKMRFGVSNGMVLAAGPGGDELFALSPDEGATPGMRVK